MVRAARATGAGKSAILCGVKPISYTLAGLAALAGTASAHTGLPHTHSPFLDGLAHPWLGLDHLAAMAAVGAWAAQLGGSLRYKLPAAFMTAMLVGAILGLELGAWAFADTGILCTIAGLGLLVGLAARPAAPAAFAAAAAAGLLHGYAHGAEAPAAPAAYFAGFLLATAALHALGLALATLALRGGNGSARLVRGAGFAAAAAAAFALRP
jgi:urease accessory protein